jgi:hypothetical protein
MVPPTTSTPATIPIFFTKFSSKGGNPSDVKWGDGANTSGIGWCEGTDLSDIYSAEPDTDNWGKGVNLCGQEYGAQSDPMSCGDSGTSDGPGIEG